MLKRIICLVLILLIVPLSSTQSSLTRDFFVNLENGQPGIKVVYGTYAAEEDYDNALRIAEAVANYLCYIEEWIPQYLWPDPLKGTAPNNTEVILTPDMFGYLWYSGKPQPIYDFRNYDETKAHEEIRFKTDLPNQTILYMEYIITNIKPGDDIWFLGKMYHVNSIEEDRLSCEGKEFVSSTQTPYWYNTTWFFKVYQDKIKLYMENVPMRTSTPIKALTTETEWLLNIIIEWRDETEFGYTIQCGRPIPLSEEEKTKTPIGVDPYSMLIRDTELTREMKLEYDLILVGGPGMVLQSSGDKKTANIVAEEVLLGGYSDVNWYVSMGKYEYIERAFSDKGVVIVAGKDRESTTAGTELFIELIKELA